MCTIVPLPGIGGLLQRKNRLNLARTKPTSVGVLTPRDRNVHEAFIRLYYNIFSICRMDNRLLPSLALPAITQL